MARQSNPPRDRRSASRSWRHGSNTRAKPSSGSARARRTIRRGTPSRMGHTIEACGDSGIEIARAVPGTHAGRFHAVAAFLDDLRVDDFLRVEAVNPAGVLEARHHLVERRPGPPHAVALQFAPNVLARLLVGEQRADDDELEDRKSTRLNSSHLGISY